jgi:hypothetical protein
MAACILSMPREDGQHSERERGKSWIPTFMAQVHLDLEGLELFGQAGAGLCAHLLVCPLLQTVEFLVDVHDCGVRSVEEARVEGRSRAARWGGGGW